MQSAKKRAAKVRQQKRSYGCAKVGGVVARWSTFPGLPWRKRVRKLKELARSYLAITKDLTRVMNRLKALYRSQGIQCSGTRVYISCYRDDWLGKLREAGIHRRAERLYLQLDVVKSLRQEARRDLLAESHKHRAARLLRRIPCIGPIRAALLIAFLQPPHRFRTKRQLWSYSGLALETRDSGEYRYVQGQLQRVRRHPNVRGLNQNYNHDLKDLFKSTASRASRCAGPFHDFYAARVVRGMKPAMALLTLARKIAAITLIIWKKGEHFDAERLKQQAA
jgi:hypothetical protein